VHRPRATENQDCLCLTVVAAPPRVTGLFGVLINPFLRIEPA
jgi:putative transcriptional regulator